MVDLDKHQYAVIVYGPVDMRQTDWITGTWEHVRQQARVLMAVNDWHTDSGDPFGMRGPAPTAGKAWFYHIGTREQHRHGLTGCLSVLRFADSVPYSDRIGWTALEVEA